MQKFSLETDPDVFTVIQFMQAHVQADRLMQVGAAVGALSKLLWERHDNPTQSVVPLSILGAISDCDRRIRSVSNE